MAPASLLTLTSASPLAGSPSGGNNASSTGGDGSVKSKLKNMFSASGNKLNSLSSGSNSPVPPGANGQQVNGPAEEIKAAKRTLYTANAGDARAVLSCVCALSALLRKRR